LPSLGCFFCFLLALSPKHVLFGREDTINSYLCQVYCRPSLFEGFWCIPDQHFPNWRFYGSAVGNTSNQEVYLFQFALATLARWHVGKTLLMMPSCTRCRRR
jgi:hypothetical protein